MAGVPYKKAVVIFQGVAHPSMRTYAVAYRNCEAPPMKNITVSVLDDGVGSPWKNVPGWLNKLLILLRIMFNQHFFLENGPISY